MKIQFMTLKKIGAVLLLVSFFLPLSRCENIRPLESDDQALTQEAPDDFEKYEYFYAWEGISKDQPLTIIVFPLAFLWPFIFIGLRRRFKTPKITRNFLILEPIAALLGAYFVFIISSLNALYIGFFVATTGALLFFLGSVIEILEFFKKPERRSSQQ